MNRRDSLKSILLGLLSPFYLVRKKPRPKRKPTEWAIAVPFDMIKTLHWTRVLLPGTDRTAWLYKVNDWDDFRQLTEVWVPSPCAPGTYAVGFLRFGFREDELKDRPTRELIEYADLSANLPNPRQVGNAVFTSQDYPPPWKFL